MFIGLTGGMGCGKSSALHFFSDWNFITLDADAICHCLYSDSNSGIFNKIHSRWGDRVLSRDREIDRASVGKIVFSSPDELKWLNSVLHPAIIAEGLKIHKESNGRIVIFDIPLLFEVQWESFFDKTVAIWCSEKIRRKRLIMRGMNKKDIENRDKQQLPSKIKMERADYAIINNSSLDNLKDQCKKTADTLLSVAGNTSDINDFKNIQ